MKHTRIHPHLPNSGARRFRSGVSLHSHTLYSRESLDFIDRAAHHSRLLRELLRRGDARHRACHGAGMDLRQGWWTPPLSPADAWRLEAGQIAGLGLEPIVSLTDHDDMRAASALQVRQPDIEVPHSVEWTVPWQRTFFHIGVHNLPVSRAAGVMEQLAAFTARPLPAELPGLLEWISSLPGTLVVLNHPLWDEKGVGVAAHRSACETLLQACRPYLHALEMNGLRPWRENAAAFDLARRWEKPIVSGGDRHGVEPNANLNLTAAASFAEFASEVRDGWSEVLIMPQYQHCYFSRIVHNMIDILQPFPEHALGWCGWEDRVFYQLPAGDVKSLRQCWGERVPAPVWIFETTMRAMARPHFRWALRRALSREEMPALTELA